MEPSHKHPVEKIQNLLKVGIGLSLLIFLLELIGGLWTHSLALLSDAWHVFIDIWSLVISFLAVYVAKRPVSDRQTFGFHRMEVFAALVNGLLVFLIAIGILYAAWRRLYEPVPVHSKMLLGLAAVGLAMNMGVAWFFYRESGHDLNIRGAFLHMLGDAMNTLAVLVAALLMVLTKSSRIDPIVSGVIAVIVLWGAFRLLRDSLNTLLEGVPSGIRVLAVEEEMKQVQGVVSVHDLHVWSICSHLKALSGHVLLSVDQMPNQHAVLERIRLLMKDRFGIEHTTIQVESKAWPNMEPEERNVV